LAWGVPYLAAPGLSQFFAAGWTMSIAGWNAWMLGRPDQARTRVGCAFAMIEDDAYSQTSIRWVAAKLHVMLREPEQAADVAAQAMALCEEHGFDEIGLWAKGELGWALAHLGRVDEGLDLARNATPLLTVALTCLAEVQLLAGRLGDAARSLDEALTLVPEEGCWRPETMRLRGEVHRTLGEHEQGETQFRSAIALAQERSAKSWELRAAMSMVRLMGEQGRRREARDLLAPVYGWFTEGFDTADLKDANALLDELR
jgi:tetratricopeptide (TPR) repeat protein